MVNQQQRTLAQEREWQKDEPDFLKSIAVMASKIGYANVVSHVLREWQIHLMNHSGLTESAARRAVLYREPYALSYHRPPGLPEPPDEKRGL